jgi:putative DNA primase/helicase
MATGNNLIFKGDITRRVLLCTMDAHLERPDERRFDRNLYEDIPKHRGRLIVSVLTALMAYHKAGRPDMGLTPYGGFEEWSAWVRSTIVWAGLADPCETRRRIEAEDPDKNLHERFLQTWFEAFGDQPLALKDAIFDCRESEEPQLKNLWEVLREIAPEGRNDVNPNKLSRGFMHRHKDVLRDDLKLAKDPGSPGNLARWRVVAVTARQRLKVMRAGEET